MTSFVLRHKTLTVCFWLLLALCGAKYAGTMMHRMDYTYTTPGQPGFIANQHILDSFRIDGTFEPFLAVLRLPQGSGMDTPAGQAIAAKTFDSAENAGIVGVADYANTRNPVFILDHGQTTWALINLPNPDKGPGAGIEGRVDPAMQQAVAPGSQLTLTGFAQMLSNAGPNRHNLIVGLELGIVAAAIVLLLVYGSAIAIVPVLMALPAILVTFLSALGLTYLTSVSYFVPYMIILLSPGLAVDYSLIVVTRWREEREQGLANNSAIRSAISSAGETVILSGVTVAVGLFSLVVLPVPFLRSVGVGGLLVPLIATAAALTLLPIALAAWGPWLDRLRLWKTSTTFSRGWERWGRMILRYRWLAAVIALGVLGALTFPALSINTAEPLIGSLPQNGPAAQTFKELLRAGIPSAVDFPVQVITHGGGEGRKEAMSIALATPGVYTVLSPDTPAFRHGGDSLLTVITKAEGGTHEGKAIVVDLRKRLQSVAGGAEVGGSTAGDVAFSDAVYGHFPLMLTIVCLLSIAILTRALRSLVLSLKAVLLNVVSLGSAFGFMVLFWQRGYGSELIFGVPATAAIRDWIPVVVFACLFGLAMDYEVFVLSRIREEYDRLNSTDEAVVQALARTGRLVTSAAVILMISFLALSGDPNQIPKIISTTLAVGVVVDAFIIRTLLVPALVSLMGKWNWWTPSWLRQKVYVKN
jgi:putative drug exporter of the RND superfamily